MAWERAGLIAALAEGELYSFEHLSRLRALREMRSKRISARSIKAQVEEMQRRAGMRNALAETSAVRCGGRLAFRHGGALVDALTQQLAFDFGTAPGRELAMVGNGGPASAAEATARVQEMFVRAVQLEEKPAKLADAIRAYEEILALKPDHAPACINLGTIFYNQRQFADAERMYRQATEADPEYALAFFDLGNVLDEMQRLNDAIAAYQAAIRIAYARLDPVGPWALHAKGQSRKILAMECLSIVSRGGLRVASAG